MTDRTLPEDKKLCEDCPPVGYPTDKTRCTPCPRAGSVPSAHEACTDCGAMVETKSGGWVSIEEFREERADRDRLRTVLDWMLNDSDCHIWNGWYSQRIADTPEPLKSLVAAEINAYRVSKGAAPL